MTDFSSDLLGTVQDSVKLILGGEEVLVAEGYEVAQGILTQPAAWSMRLGHGAVARELSAKFPPRTPFQLKVADVLQQTGATDGFVLDGSTGATMVTLRGRDALAPLHDAYVTEEQAFTNATYADLVIAALSAVGLPNTLIYSNEANRKAVTGVGVQQLAPPVNVEELRVEATSAPTAVKKSVQAKLGERRYDYVKRQLDRAGLFLWAASDGTFILSEPNAKQAPTYRIVRRRGLDRNTVNVTHATWTNDTTHRFSEAVVYSRGGGRKFGKGKTKGAFVDEEMVALGFKRPLVFRDVNVGTLKQAEFYARRKIAESRRAGWQLRYTVAGHTVPSLVSGERAVWAPDTVVDVEDDEFGLRGKFWIESVTFKRPPTTTELVLMRPEDLVFGSDEA